MSLLLAALILFSPIVIGFSLIVWILRPRKPSSLEDVLKEIEEKDK